MASETKKRKMPNHAEVNSMINIAQSYIHWADAQMSRYNLEIIPSDIMGSKVFHINERNGRNIGYVEMMIIIDDKYKYKTRSQRGVSGNSIYIASLEINEEFQGRGLATFLILYGLSKLYEKNPSYTYLTLEDASEGVYKIKGNIYSELGFVPEGHIKLSNNQKRILPITADGAKSQSFEHLFKAIYPVQIPKLEAKLRRFQGGRKATHSKRRVHRRYKKRLTRRKL